MVEGTEGGVYGGCCRLMGREGDATPHNLVSGERVGTRCRGSGARQTIDKTEGVDYGQGGPFAPHQGRREEAGGSPGGQANADECYNNNKKINNNKIDLD